MVGAPRVFTIGHSTRSQAEFVALLRAIAVTLLIDVRIAPGSRRFPHFGETALTRALETEGIRYLHVADLGGRRRPRADSPHVGWRVEGFRGYADHMESEEFRQALHRVLDEARHETAALMCAEAVPWRCHRQLIADALTIRGCAVTHILGPGNAQAHTLTSFARIDGTHLIYDSTERESKKRESPETPARGTRRSGGQRGRRR